MCELIILKSSFVKTAAFKITMLVITSVKFTISESTYQLFDNVIKTFRAIAKISSKTKL